MPSHAPTITTDRASHGRRTLRGVALAVAMGLLLAACTGGEGDGAGDGVGDGAGGTLSIAANPWPGSYANAHVAAEILRRELGLEVRIVEIDENAQWAGLDDGSIDASLEIWPSGHADNVATYIDELGTVEHGGPLGAIGQIGWFMPSFVLASAPGLTTWEGLRGSEGLFATTETRSSGRFLAADPSFVQFDEAIIANLGLDLVVVQSGSEAAQLATVEAAIGRNEPVLFYFYTPHWLHARYDLTMVELPEWSEECEALPAAQRDCGYPEDVLFKAFHAGFAQRLPQAHAVLSAMRLRNEDQDAITFAMDVEGLDAADAARAWVDANEAIWRTWLP
jgi:glycine betaine/proline transport system substrate-binding protein